MSFVRVKEHEIFDTLYDSDDESLLTKSNRHCIIAILEQSERVFDLVLNVEKFLYFSISAPLYWNHIKSGSIWKKYGVTVAGGNGQGAALSQLNHPFTPSFLTTNQFLYIVERDNHRVTKWKLGSMVGQIVAGGNGKGSRSDQLDLGQMSIVVDRGRDSVFISDALAITTALFNGRFRVQEVEKQCHFKCI